MRIFPNSRPTEMIDLGAINIKPGADTEKVLQKLKDNLSDDVKVFSKKEFIEFEKNYWSQRTPIGFILQLMLTMGAIVGIVIVYQILYSNISSQFVAYATLKAIGYENMYLLNVVFQQALILAILGYIPGFALSLGLYDFAGKATNLPIVMTFMNALSILVATVFMCIISGALALKKLRAADPADIF
jgi:putative ABC transport system permease protein